jgi:hypothetical protein
VEDLLSESLPGEERFGLPVLFLLVRLLDCYVVRAAVVSGQINPDTRIVYKSIKCQVLSKLTI